MKLRFVLALVCCLASTTSSRAQLTDPIHKGTIKFVQQLQQKNGGFLPDNSKKKQGPTLRATSSAIRALKYLGAKVPNKEACAKFVASCYDKDSGGFADQPGKGKPDVFTTAVGLMAVAELGMPNEPYHAGAIKYLADHVKTFDDVRIAVAGLERIKAKSPKSDAWRVLVEEQGNQKTGGGGRARDMASYAVTHMRLGGELKNPNGFKKVLQEGQQPSGGYSKGIAENADLESSYRVMRCLMMLKALPAEVEGLRSFVAKCRNNEDNGYCIDPGETTSTMGATYFAIIILHWLEEGEKKK